MVLKTVCIENFKCIEDSNEFRIDQVTCLVGKNESGKTALLQALYKLNPDIKEQADFNYVEEYPRRHLSDYEERLKSGGTQDNVLTTVWELNDAEKKALETLIPQAARISTVKIRKGYDNKRHWEASLNEGEVADHLLKTSGLHQEEADVLKGVKTVSELLEKLKAVSPTYAPDPSLKIFWFPPAGFPSQHAFSETSTGDVVQTYPLAEDVRRAR